jgi:hypothetical protein
VALWADDQRVEPEAGAEVKLKERFALWILKRRIVAAIKKGTKMTPLPKWVAWLGNIGAVGGVVASIAGMLPPKYAAIAAALAALLNSISHSLPGTGGTAVNP